MCNAMLALLDKFLMRNRSDFQGESKVFSLEMATPIAAWQGPVPVRRKGCCLQTLHSAEGSLRNHPAHSHARHPARPEPHSNLRSRKIASPSSLLAFHGALTQLDSLNDYSIRTTCSSCGCCEKTLTLWRATNRTRKLEKTAQSASVPSTSYAITEYLVLNLSEAAQLLRLLISTLRSREAVLDKFIGVALSPWKLPFNWPDRYVPKEAFSVLCLLI